MTFEQFTDLINDYKQSFDEILKLELMADDFQELAEDMNYTSKGREYGEPNFYCKGIEILRGTGPYSYIAEVEDMLRNTSRPWIRINDKYLKKQVGKKYSHKCTCSSYDIFNFGCKCGGV